MRNGRCEIEISTLESSRDRAIIDRATVASRLGLCGIRERIRTRGDAVRVGSWLPMKR